MADNAEFDAMIIAEEHLRFVLNTTEGVLGALGTSIRTASQAEHVQPETKRAFEKVGFAQRDGSATLRPSTPAVRLRVTGSSEPLPDSLGKDEKVMKALDKAFSATRDERAKASAAMKKRVLDKARMAP